MSSTTLIGIVHSVIAFLLIVALGLFIVVMHDNLDSSIIATLIGIVILGLNQVFSGAGHALAQDAPSISGSALVTLLQRGNPAPLQPIELKDERTTTIAPVPPAKPSA